MTSSRKSGAKALADERNVFDPHAPFDPPQEYLDRYNPANLPKPLFRETDLTAQLAIPGDFQNPARPPEEFNAREIIAAYYAMIELIDENVGRLLDALEETGQREIRSSSSPAITVRCWATTVSC